jgi:hypothetical protein
VKIEPEEHMAKEVRPVLARGVLFGGLVLALSVGLVALVTLGAGYASSDDKKTDDKKTDDKNVEAAIVQLKAELDSAKKELEVLRKRNEELEDKVVALVKEVETAKKEAVRAQNALKLGQAIADDNAKKIEELTARLNELKLLQGKAPPAIANVRGEVTQVDGDLVKLSIGIDAGLEAGTVLDVYRLEKSGGRYLGTVKVTSALNLFPKQAIVTFIPARNVPLAKLRPDELPRKGDEVRSPEALAPEKK